MYYTSCDLTIEAALTRSLIWSGSGYPLARRSIRSWGMAAGALDKLPPNAAAPPPQQIIHPHVLAESPNKLGEIMT